MRQLLSRIRAFFGVRAMDRDFDQELESHLAMMAEDYERRGMTPRAVPVACVVPILGAAAADSSSATGKAEGRQIG